MINIPIPDNVKKRGSRVAFKLFYHLMRFEQGKGLIGRLTSTFQEVGIYILVLKSFGVKLTPLMVGLIIILMVKVLYWVGYFYLKHNADKIDNLVRATRNPMIDEMHKKLMFNENGKYSGEEL